MTVYKVLGTLKIGENTAVIIDGTSEHFKNGTGILDASGRPFVVQSVGMDDLKNPDAGDSKTSLLIEGQFASDKIFV